MTLAMAIVGFASSVSALGLACYKLGFQRGMLEGIKAAKRG